MIAIIDCGAEDLQGIAAAMTRSTCGSTVTWDLSAAAGAAAAMLPDSISIVIRLGK